MSKDLEAKLKISDQSFKRKLFGGREFCCSVNDIIEEYLNVHSITNIPFVNTCADLPDPTTHDEQIWGVIQDSGTKWIPSWVPFVGTYCPHGLYWSDGTEWEYLGVFPFQASQTEVDAGVNNEKFVTPYTLENAAKWDTKQAVIDFQAKRSARLCRWNSSSRVLQACRAVTTSKRSGSCIVTGKQIGRAHV